MRVALSYDCEPRGYNKLLVAQTPWKVTGCKSISCFCRKLFCKFYIPERNCNRPTTT